MSAEKNSFFSSFIDVLYTTKLFFGVADAHWFIMISANTDNKFRIQSEIFLIACNNHAIFLKLLSTAQIALLGRYEFQMENSIFPTKIDVQEKGKFQMTLKRHDFTNRHLLNFNKLEFSSFYLKYRSDFTAIEIKSHTVRV